MSYASNNMPATADVYQEVPSYGNVSIVELVASQEFGLLQGLPQGLQC